MANLLNRIRHAFTGSLEAPEYDGPNSPTTQLTVSAPYSQYRDRSVDRVRAALQERSIRTFDIPVLQQADLKVLLSVQSVLIPNDDVQYYLMQADRLIRLVSDLIVYKAENDTWGIPTSWQDNPMLSGLVQRFGRNHSLIKALLDLLTVYMFPYCERPEAFEMVGEIIELRSHLAQVTSDSVAGVTGDIYNQNNMSPLDSLFGSGGTR